MLAKSIVGFELMTQLLLRGRMERVLRERDLDRRLPDSSRRVDDDVIVLRFRVEQDFGGFAKDLALVGSIRREWKRLVECCF